MTKRLRLSPFSLKDTIECGQFFRFTKVENTYLIQTSNRIFSLWQKEDLLYYDGVEESFLSQFFRLEDDFEDILKRINLDPVICQAIRRYRGLRLIRQDPWECLISFLFSSAKAIPNIRCLIEALCRVSGRKVAQGSHISYGFPAPAFFHCNSIPREVRAGFRITHLIETGRSINRDQLFLLKKLDYEQARKELMQLRGVGKKIADCVLLYSLDFLEAFPMDTWIKRGLEKSYFSGEKMGEKGMEDFVRSHFGPYGGYAQLYLYHYWRNYGFS